MIISSVGTQFIGGTDQSSQTIPINVIILQFSDGVYVCVVIIKIEEDTEKWKRFWNQLGHFWGGSQQKAAPSLAKLRQHGDSYSEYLKSHPESKIAKILPISMLLLAGFAH